MFIIKILYTEISKYEIVSRCIQEISFNMMWQIFWMLVQNILLSKWVKDIIKKNTINHITYEYILKMILLKMYHFIKLYL